MTGTDLVPYEEGVQMIMGEALPEIESNEDAQNQILAQIIAADDLAGLFQDRTTTAAVKMQGVPLRVTDMRLRRSTLDAEEEGAEEKAGVYALIDAELLDNGQPVTLNTGSKNIMMTLWRAKQLKRLPVEVVIVEVSKAKGRKQAAIGLKPWGETLKAFEAEQKARTTKDVGNVNAGKR